MTTLDRFALVAATAVPSGRSVEWRRYTDPDAGFSFEVPFEMEAETAEGPFGVLAEGRMTLPFVFDVTYMASREATDATPEALAYGMATQWRVDYDIVRGPTVRRVELPGIDEAWALTAEIIDGPGTIDYAWMVLAKGGRIACLGVSCWTAEPLGREAQGRTLASILGF